MGFGPAIPMGHEGTPTTLLLAAAGPCSRGSLMLGTKGMGCAATSTCQAMPFPSALCFLQADRVLHTADGTSFSAGKERRQSCEELLECLRTCT